MMNQRRENNVMRHLETYGGVKQYRRKSRAKQNYQWDPEGTNKRREKAPVRTNWNEQFNVGTNIQSASRSTDVQVKMETRLLTVTEFNTAHADCCNT